MKCVMMDTRMTRNTTSWREPMPADAMDLTPVVAEVLSSLGIEQARGLFYRVGTAAVRPDFVARTPDGLSIAIEVPESVDARALHRLFAWYDQGRRHGTVHGLLLVTVDPPTDADLARFAAAFDDDAMTGWIAIADLPEALEQFEVRRLGSTWSPWTWRE